MKVFAVMNFEPDGQDVKIGVIVTKYQGGVILEMCHDGRGSKKPYRNLNEALAEVRERHGWPGGLFGAGGGVMVWLWGVLLGVLALVVLYFLVAVWMWLGWKDWQDEDWY